MSTMSLRHAILGFLDLEPTTGYTLQQRFEGSVGSFWSATQSQIYRELHALEQDGQVWVQVVPQEGKPARKVYALTASGRAALGRWLAEPIGPPQLRDPLLLKLVFAKDVPPAAFDAVLARYQAELEAMRAEYTARLGAPEIFALARSPRERTLWELSLENGLRWCDALIGWTADARRRLGPAPKPRARRRPTRA
jgi:PadR family transcriptional regulator, regulatory protein AphA